MYVFAMNLLEALTYENHENPFRTYLCSFACAV